jgi:hypothetical protein
VTVGVEVLVGVAVAVGVAVIVGVSVTVGVELAVAVGRLPAVPQPSPSQVSLPPYSRLSHAAHSEAQDGASTASTQKPLPQAPPEHAQH